MMKILTLLLNTAVCIMSVSAQTTEYNDDTVATTSLDAINTDFLNSGPSKISFRKPETENYILIMDSIDRKSAIQNGFRIQLFSASVPEAKETIFQLQSEFIRKHEEMSSYADWSSPNWVLRIGNYRNRLEASQALDNLKVDYPAAFILADQIESPYKQ
jgi:hypothetical protein